MVKVTLGEQPAQSEKPFPKLMIGGDSGNIVFFSKPAEGIVLSLGPRDLGRNSVGTYRNTFNMTCFTDYNEPIAIQNA
jgi:hypothetical protein